MSIRQSSFALFSCLAISQACVYDTSADNEDAESVGVVQQELFVGKSYVWKPAVSFGTVTIPVCWEPTAVDYTTEKGWAKAAVLATWGKYSNVVFTGWGTCPAVGTVTNGLRVLFRNARGASLPGTSAKDVQNGVLLNAWRQLPAGTSCDVSNVFTVRECVESTAVHEFGHALAFYHEQDRPDCFTAGGQGCVVGQSGQEVGRFDDRSIMYYDNLIRNNAGTPSQKDIAGVLMYYGTRRLGSFGFSAAAGGWRSASHVRTTADVNGDRCADVVGFGANGVDVALSKCKVYDTPSATFASAAQWSSSFGNNAAAGSWNNASHVRTLADVNGDGRADVVGFKNDGVWVALSTGAAFNPPARWIAWYGSDAAAGSFSVTGTPRFVLDVNGDKRADLVGFAPDGVYVSLSNGAGFDAQRLVVRDFGTNAGWNSTTHIRTLADVNGDGRPDIVGFKDTNVQVSKQSFTPLAFTYSAPTSWITGYTVNSGGWTLAANPRFLADVDGDLDADIVGFANDRVQVSKSTGTSFGAATTWLGGYFGTSAAAGSWDPAVHIRQVADLNKDGRADIVGFYGVDVIASTSAPGFDNFGRVFPWAPNFDVNNGWTVTENPRTLADVDADGIPELVGFGNDGVHVTSLSTHLDDPAI